MHVGNSKGARRCQIKAPKVVEEVAERHSQGCLEALKKGTLRRSEGRMHVLAIFSNGGDPRKCIRGC